MIDVSRAWLAALLLVASCAHSSSSTKRTPAPAPEPPLPAPAVAPPPAPLSRAVRIVRPKSELGSPIFSVKLDGARVFFNDGAGRLWSAPKDGSATATLVVGDPRDSVRSFVIVGDTIYYAGRHELRSVPITGGASTILADDHGEPILLVTDGKDIYHTVFDGSGTFRFSLDKKRGEKFCPGAKHQTLAIDDVNLYIASYSASTIVAVSKKTRRTRVLAIGARRPVRLVVDAGYVYFSSEGDGTVRRVAKRGGPVDILARGQKNQEHLALDDGHIYWTTRTKTGWALMRAPSVPTVGAQPEALYTELQSASGLAVDDRFVYVADRGAGNVVRVAKTFP